jgi:hypothetical protein
MPGTTAKPPTISQNLCPAIKLSPTLTPAAPPVNCGGVDTLGTVPFLVDVGILLDSSALDDALGLNGALLLTFGKDDAITGVEVGGAMEPNVGVPAWVGVANVSVALREAKAEFAATSFVAVRLKVVKYVVRVEVSWYVAAK